MKLKSLIAITLISLTSITFSCKKEKNESNAINVFSIQDDINFGKKFDAQIAADPAQYPLLDESKYASAYQHIRRIRDSILNSGEVAHKADFVWQVKIINNDSVVNAFAVPSGYMYFYTGLIKTLDNEAQFAGVMAHEMAHVSRRHSTEQLTKAYGVELLLSLVLGNNSSKMAEIAANLAGGLASLAFSRDDEYEADKYAMIYLHKTSYHEKGIADFFTKLGGESKTPTFLSTHPSPSDRIQKIEENWVSLGSKVGNYYEESYQAFKNSLK